MRRSPERPSCNNLTANNLFLGRFGHTGRIVDDGAVRVNHLFAELSVQQLTGGNDIVDTEIELRSAARITVQQALDQTTGLTLNGNTLELFDTSVLDLQFDANTLGLGLDWAFRWANPAGGDRIAAIQGMLSAGRISVSSPNRCRVSPAWLPR